MTARCSGMMGKGIGILIESNSMTPRVMTVQPILSFHLVLRMKVQEGPDFEAAVGTRVNRIVLACMRRGLFHSCS